MSADYFRIRELERDLGMEQTPFPDWLPSMKVPDSLAQDIGPVVTWAQAAEALEASHGDFYAALSSLRASADPQQPA